MGSLTELFEKHPVAVFVAIGIVVLLALRSGSSAPTGGGGVSFSGGGEIAPSVDPNVAGIMNAETNAAQTEFGNLASLVAQENQTTAQETLGLAQTNATIEANKLSAQVQSEVTQAQLQAEQSALLTEFNMANNSNQTEKDIARATDNTSIAGSIIGGVTTILKWL